MNFKIEFTSKAVKDLKSFNPESQKQIIEATIRLEKNPFPFKNKIRKIKGVKFPCFKLRLNLIGDSVRIFYGLDKNTIYVLRIVSKKDAEEIIINIRTKAFPPEK